MRIRPVTRGSRGGDAVHCATYRGGRTLWNERTGELHKWGAREDVHDVGIVLPEALAQDPRYEWAKDPYKLWNTAEFSETQRNARVARDYMMILPKELSQEQRRTAVYGFAQALAERYGNAIDVALHDERPGRARYYHAHLLATTRKVGQQGLLEKTDAEIGGERRAARGLSTPYAAEFEWARGLWEHTLQKAIKEAGLPRRVYDTLYREYDQGESTWEYKQRLMREGFDLRAQQREDRRKTQLTPEERREAQRKKVDILKLEHLQRMARAERQRLSKHERTAGRVRSQDAQKRLWLTRWDNERGLLTLREAEPQLRRVGETPAMVAQRGKTRSRPESEHFKPTGSIEPLAREFPAPIQPRSQFAQEWLAYRFAEKQESKSEPTQDWLQYRASHESLSASTTSPTQEWLMHHSTHATPVARNSEIAQGWLAYKLTEHHERDAVDMAQERAREWLALRGSAERSQQPNPQRPHHRQAYELSL